MASANKKQTINDQYIISKYMNYVLEHDAYPKSVYKFCKDNKIKEEEFYTFFGSLDSMDKSIWNAFFITAVDAMNRNKEYASFSTRDKMLTLYYTLFEVLTLNRSYVLFALKRYDIPFKNLNQLRGFRTHIKNFAKELIEIDNDEKMFKITKNPISVFSEGAWLQFLFLLNFWVGDESAGFEKTDVAIEKSVHTIFDLFDNTPLNNVLDFGKFLWNEKVRWN
ncbi:TetR family transcriptional regulator C-terminal domain-containing protein [Aquimarina mytili]|uniref:TetR/AcrR family transcriptional regulator n=1 Tax=Aquimarina mytili TaxID=874423 RepID=A0A937D9W1_9FLAO|nr:TetR family transcriptional regulator C-terminal domain-containing protein [Aquimarina mytili]MBL0684102.1 TetR/AcrR family transcriptional regulator [Aquimarina mytili]